jgi:arylsulfatase A-like enzyme
LTDDRTVAEHPLAETFDERIVVPQDEAPLPAAEVEATHMFRLFAAAGQWLAAARQPFLLWIHARGMAGPWDAPVEFRRQFVEEDDPLPPDATEVPCRCLGADADPDELLALRYAYGGQALLLDLCVGALSASLAESPLANTTMLSLLSARGFPLGEHGRIGCCDDALYEELVHVPWMLRLPDGQGALGRSSALVTPADLNATLLDWFGLDGLQPGEAARAAWSVLPLVQNDAWVVPRQCVCLRGAGSQLAIRTVAWHLRIGPDDRAELFAKPDDRWEVNDVADRCEPVVTRLRQVLAHIIQASQSGDIHQTCYLDQTLTDDWH